jgi:hypothetical protein
MGSEESPADAATREINLALAEVGQVEDDSAEVAAAFGRQVLSEAPGGWPGGTEPREAPSGQG